MNVNHTDIVSEGAHKDKCLKTLKELGAPFCGWMCIGVEDIKSSLGILVSCELCGCEGIRFLHYMGHPDYDKELAVGCICAGVMEGDELAARERERRVRRRSERQQRFLKRKWRPLHVGSFYDGSILTCKHRGERIFIKRADENLPGAKLTGYDVIVQGEKVQPAEGTMFKTFDEAVRAAFEWSDPPELL